MKHLFLFLSILLFFNCDNDSSVENNQENEELVDVELDEENDTPENLEVYNADVISESLVFVVENGGDVAYVVNKDGEELYNWNFDNNLGNDLELLPTGQVLGIFKPDNTSFSFGGYGGIVQIINLNGSIEWEYTYNSDDFLAHHDVELLPNGNLLIMAWERISPELAASKGVFVNHDLFPEKLIEVDYVTKEIVWEWRSWDHIIQNLNEGFDSYAEISEYPNKIDINYYDEPNGDIMHANAIEYDSNKDIIYLSVNYYSEVWVIDHSTTTEEASGFVGGTYNLGGDLIYRFGNPKAYDNLMGEQIFDRNHFPNLIEAGFPGEGNLMVFDNGRTAQQSTAYELEIPENFNLIANTDNEPNVVWSFTDSNMFSERVSSAVRLLNGNTLICESDYGFWEITETGEIAWKYKKEGSFWRCYAFENNNPVLPILGL
ncbi:aryl-sulfate sulfotransferase [Cellulophaga baltica]|uniref:aryl-sulfate sulfotransferase n=1 Tax=Cellulophaga TaxID=104264 RepID=UPI001C071430|nr:MULTISPECIES: aryl-sulfate sulfotransferase [Cellulophaga]MBU2994852.1 aryl-sulfate sulfotransferase [Cellulophaga baltica]MDO6766247.1 aryl-sulfate sulfotransferase [Cellulophaga sp. 1_MG-2023]